jgi:hypothetical protein
LIGHHAKPARTPAEPTHATQGGNDYVIGVTLAASFVSAILRPAASGKPIRFRVDKHTVAPKHSLGVTPIRR